MPTQTADAVTTESPMHQSIVFQAAAVAGLVLATLVLLVSSGGLMEYATAALTLVNGPLIDGPLVDAGGTLSELQVGQFQQ